MTHLVINKKGWADWQFTVVQVICTFGIVALLFKDSASNASPHVVEFMILMSINMISNYQQGYNAAHEKWAKALLNSDSQISLHIDKSRVQDDE